MKALSYGEARKTREKHTLSNGTYYWKSEYFQSELKEGPSPQSFLVEQEPNSQIRPHFHRVNQFQVIVGGSGKLGKHAVSPLTVHYADSYTPYGPLFSGEDGLVYFTLRANTDFGANFMPESKKLMQKSSSKFSTTKHVPLLSEVISDAPQSTLETIIDPNENKVAAYLAHVPPNYLFSGPELKNRGGQYTIVVNGTIVINNDLYDKLSCLFTNSCESNDDILAGEYGAQLLILQFPEEEIQ